MRYNSFLSVLALFNVLLWFTFILAISMTFSAINLLMSKKFTMKNVQPTRLDWFLVLLPYVIGLFFAIFDSATIGQVFFWGFMTHLVAIFLYFVFRYPLTAIWGFVVGITA